MFNFNGPAAMVTFSAFALILGLMIVFSSRDTKRGFREFWDVTAFHRLLRKYRRVSLRSILTITAVVAPLVVVAWMAWSHGSPAFFLVGGLVTVYLCEGIIPLIFIFYKDAFGKGPRAIWQKHLNEWE